ncbi:MAG: HD-GYP domain-containing protein [Bryobacteraceae bacterium]
MTEGQPFGHSLRSCVFAMHIAEEIGLSRQGKSDLYYAALLKDAGCSSNASRLFQILGTDDIQAKRDVKTTDWTRLNWESLQYAISHVRTNAPFLERVKALARVAIKQNRNAQELVQIRCERGAAIARRVGLSEQTAEAIGSLDELWNGKGQPVGLRKREIPLLSRILNLAQTVEVFFSSSGPEAAMDVIRTRSGRWFDPDLVKAFQSVANRAPVWHEAQTATTHIESFTPDIDPQTANEADLDNICLAFADVIDAKSPFTYRHSMGVAGAAIAIAHTLGLEASEVATIRRAALLHDIGKLGVSNAILDKPGKLTNEEWESVRKHPHNTLQILKRVPGFSAFSEIAAAHHEKLDGSGYFLGISGEQLDLPARILVVADIYDALAAKRPYRDALPIETVFEIMGRDTPRAIDADCFKALQMSYETAERNTADLLNLSCKMQGHQNCVQEQALAVL